jgi:phospholipid/cholesterol/gamma-HCH transport system substrate-binding protein
VTGRSVLWRMGILAAAFLAALAYILLDVVGLRVGAQPSPVSVVLPQAGGLYPGSYVTYRGVDVGRVSTLTLHRTDVVAVASLNPGVRVPADVTAHVRDLTAIGEQYLDLVPPAHGVTTAFLHAGSVIGPSRVTTPVSIGRLLADLGALVGSISPTDVHQLTQALGSGFSGTGDALRAITVTGQQLVAALQAAEPATVTLIDQADPLLRTALATDGELTQAVNGLDQVSAQLQASSGDLTAVLSNGLTVEEQLTPLLDADTASVTALLDESAPLIGVTDASQPAVQALLQVLPVFADDIGSLVHDGTIGSEISYDTAEPVCTYGTPMTEPTQATGSPVLGAQCTSTQPGQLVRGAADAPQP